MKIITLVRIIFHLLIQHLRNYNIFKRINIHLFTSYLKFCSVPQNTDIRVDNGSLCNEKEPNLNLMSIILKNYV